MPKERNKADGYREKAYEGDTKAMNRSTFNTDYILTKAENFEKAVKTLEVKGYKIC